MSNSSPSEPLSEQPSVESPRRCQREKSKHKRIQKERQKRSHAASACPQQQFDSIEQFISTCGQEYFASELAPQLARLQSQYKSSVHIKSILGKDQNVYKIKNYQNCQQHAAQYIALANALQSVRLERVGLKLRDMKLAVDFCRPKLKGEGKRRTVVFLRKGDAVLLRKRREVWKEIDDFLKRLTNNFKENQHVDQIEREILTLCKLNTASEQAIMNALCKLQDHNGPSLPPANDDSISDEYISLLTVKNLRRCFDETPLDLLNYFKEAEVRERNIHDDVELVKLGSASELRQFLRSRKQRYRSQHSLHTCCSGCFSNHYEIYNPIESCSECGMRMHLYCQALRGRCQRCRYKRKTAEEKGHSQRCSLCLRGFEKGLLVQAYSTEGREEHVHTFCLLVHGLWKIHQQTLVEQIKETGNNADSICKFCLKSSCFHFTCPHCLKDSHGLCAYLAGCSFVMDGQGRISVSCCNSPELQERLSLERKFKMNYEKILYKKGSQLSNALLETR